MKHKKGRQQSPLNDKLRYFYCYSKRLKNALVKNGFNYICVGTNSKTGGKFYLFLGTEALNNYKDNIYQRERDLF